MNSTRSSLLWWIHPPDSFNTNLTSIRQSSSLTCFYGTSFFSAIGLAGFLLPRCCHGFDLSCAAVFASSICLGCQLGGKCCDSTHFLSRGWHPSCCHSSVSVLAQINTVPDSSSRAARQQRGFLFGVGHASSIWRQNNVREAEQIRLTPAKTPRRMFQPLGVRNTKM